MTTKFIFILFISIFIVSSFSPLLAHNRKDSEITVGESIREILDSVNEIITSGIQAADKELKEFQKLDFQNISINKHKDSRRTNGLVQFV